jgi:hypothetical protein
MGWVSGSPMRQLNSSVLGWPWASIIRPAYRKPVKGMPSFSMPRMVGRMISRMARACTFGVTTGAGEYAPMPPVLGPWSPSLQALVVLAGGQRAHVLAVAQHDEAGLFAGQELLDDDARAAFVVRHAQLVVHQHEVHGVVRLCRVMATTTPLPAARPSALMTMGAPRRSTKAWAGAGSVKVS